MTFRKFLSIVGLISIVIITFSTADNTMYDTIIKRNMQHYVIPLHYDVQIRFFFEDNMLFGLCTIIMNIMRPLDYIMLHSVPIKVIKALLINNNEGIAFSPISSSFSEENILTLRFDNKQLLAFTYPDKFILNMTYMRFITFNMSENTNSFFRYVYLKKLGHQKISNTGVEIIKGRQLFPCRDELAIKSTFKIAIKHDENYIVLSNMPVQAKYESNGEYNYMMWTNFEKSFLMSAQYVMVVLTTFTNLTAYPDTNVTIWCRQSALNHSIHAQDIIKKIVPHFRQKYIPISKLDIVAFWHSQDDNVATMGLLLQREKDIIYNKKFHPFIQKRKVKQVIARQLTFLWCYDVPLWSEEGFVTFLGTYILDEIYPNNYIMDLMVVKTQQDSFRYNTPSTVNSTVDTLVSPPNYIKSFIMWRMLYHLNSDEFWINIRKFIDRHCNYSNMTIPSEDWIPMKSTYLFPNNTHYLFLKDVMNSWITRNYYPIVNMTQNYFNSTLVINYNKSPYLLVTDKTKNWIPVTYTKQSSLNYNKSDDFFWLTSQNSTKVIQGIDKNNWIIGNVQQIGYYRVNYDFENWNRLKNYLTITGSDVDNYNKIHILNRAQFIDDAFYFVLKKQLKFHEFWELTSFMSQDTNFVTWYPMIKIFEFMSCMFPFQYGKNVTEKMRSRMDDFFLQRLGYFDLPSDDSLTIYLREEALRWACFLGVPRCQSIAHIELENEFKNSVENINNLNGKKWIFLCYGLKTLWNQTMWPEIWPKVDVINDRFLEHVTCVEDSVFICNYLSRIISGDIPLQQNKRASRFLFVAAKHANKAEVLSHIFKALPNIVLTKSINWKIERIATLIVIITHLETEDNTIKINNFIAIYDNETIQAVEKKIKKRRSEYERQIRNYEYYFS